MEVTLHLRVLRVSPWELQGRVRIRYWWVHIVVTRTLLLCFCRRLEDQQPANTFWCVLFVRSKGTPGWAALDVASTKSKCCWYTSSCTCTLLEGRDQQSERTSCLFVRRCILHSHAMESQPARSPQPKGRCKWQHWADGSFTAKWLPEECSCAYWSPECQRCCTTQFSWL